MFGRLEQDASFPARKGRNGPRKRPKTQSDVDCFTWEHADNETTGPQGYPFLSVFGLLISWGSWFSPSLRIYGPNPTPPQRRPFCSPPPPLRPPPPPASSAASSPRAPAASRKPPRRCTWSCSSAARSGSARESRWRLRGWGGR